MRYFNCEVNVIWGIDDVYFVIFLYRGCSCRGNCNIVFLFLSYLVYLRCIIVCFICFMDFIGME